MWQHMGQKTPLSFSSELYDFSNHFSYEVVMEGHVLFPLIMDLSGEDSGGFGIKHLVHC